MNIKRKENRWYFSALKVNVDLEFVSAIQNGDLERAKYWYKNGANVNYWVDHGEHQYQSIPMITACQWGHLAIVKYLVDKGVKFNWKLGCPLVVACKYGHMDVVKYLVSIGGNIRVCGDYPLREACARYGNIDVIKYLVSLGADIKVHNNYVLNTSCEIGDLAMVKFLVSKGVNIHYRMKDIFNKRFIKEYALRVAVKHGQMKVTKYLISLGSDVNEITEFGHNYKLNKYLKSIQS